MKRILINTSIFSILASMLILYSCKEEKVVPIEASGVWVESKDKADTIVFYPDNMFELKRGKEIRNGILLPKISSGLYIYNIKKDSIKVNYTISSMHVLKYYVFKMDGDKLDIGDFYQKNPGQSHVLFFERVR